MIPIKDTIMSLYHSPFIRCPGTRNILHYLDVRVINISRTVDIPRSEIKRAYTALVVAYAQYEGSPRCTRGLNENVSSSLLDPGSLDPPRNKPNHDHTNVPVADRARLVQRVLSYKNLCVATMVQKVHKRFLGLTLSSLLLERHADGAAQSKPARRVSFETHGHERDKGLQVH